MGEWHEHLTRPKPLLTNVVLHDGVAARETVLVPEAVEDALRSVPLLAVAGPIVFQDPIDDSRERTQLWPPRRRASAIPWRHRERQHLTDRLAVYTKHPRGLAGAHPLDTTRPPNPCVQLHPIHPPRLPVRATLTEGYTRSHFGPPQPDQPAASVGDYCAAVLSPLNGKAGMPSRRKSPTTAQSSTARSRLRAALSSEYVCNATIKSSGIITPARRLKA